MIKTVINRMRIIAANRNWESKRRYLIKKDDTIGEGTRLNFGIKVLNFLNKFEVKRMSKMSSVKMGNNVYIGKNAMALPSVSIGNNVIIGARAIVTHDIPDNSIAFGIPATVKKSIDEYYTTTIAKSYFALKVKQLLIKKNTDRCKKPRRNIGG